MSDRSGRADGAASGTHEFRRTTRRSLLRAGALLGATSLAGCGGTGGGSPTDDVRTGERAPSPLPTGPTTPVGTPTSVDRVRFDGGGAAALSAALRTVEANPASTIEFEPGTYRLDASGGERIQPHSHFSADGLRDVTIEGNGARLVLEDPTLGALGFFNCEGLTLRNLEFDYDPPPYTQGLITAVDEASREIEVELQAGFPGLDAPVLSDPDLTASRRFATVHDPETGDFLDVPSRGATNVKFEGVEPLGGRRYRLTGLRTMRGMARGNLLVVVARWPFKHALLVFDCVRPTLEDVTLYMAPAFAVLAGLCEAPTFRRVTVKPRPDSDRAVASTADGIHVLGCSPGPTIEDCHMERLQDDAYVVATLMNPVESVVDDRTVRVDPLPGTRIRPGDTIEGVSPDFERLGPLPAVESFEETPLALPGDWGWPAEVSFAAPISGTLEAGAFLWNRSRSNQGFSVRDCVSREVRPRHVRITSRDGIVEGNDLDGCGMPAVMLAGGTFFSPGAPPEQVTIRDNTIRRAGVDGFTTPFLGAIDAWVQLGRWRGDERPPGQPIRSLTVAGNTVTESAVRGVQVNDAADVTIRDNVIEAPNQVEYEGPKYGIGLDHDRTVGLVGNRVSGTAAELDGFAVQAASAGIEARDNSLVIDGESVPPEVVEEE